MPLSRRQRCRGPFRPGVLHAASDQPFELLRRHSTHVKDLLVDAHREVEVGELPAQELPEQVELAAYFVVFEALTNVAKYASATRASVT
jgi:signal transduction histidine kinase